MGQVRGPVIRLGLTRCSVEDKIHIRLGVSRILEGNQLANANRQQPLRFLVEMTAPSQQPLIRLGRRGRVRLGQVIHHHGPFLNHPMRSRQRHLQHRLRIVDIAPAIAEPLQILLHGHAIEFDGAFDTLCLERQQPRLIRHPEEQDVDRHVIPEQALGNVAGVDIHIAVLAGARVDTALNRGVGREQNGVVADHLTGGIRGHIDHRRRALRVSAVEIARQHAAQRI